MLVPLNTRFKGREAAYVLAQERRPARSSPSPASSTPTTCRCCATPSTSSRAARARARSWCCGRGARREPSRGTTSSPRATAVAVGRRRGPRAGRRGRRPLRHPLHLGHDRQAQGRRDRRTRRPCGPSATWSEVVGLREGDRYLIVNPFFHTFGYKAGMARRA